MHHAHRLGFHLFRPNEESLLELCFAVGNLWRSIPSPAPNLCHLRSLLCSFICLCSYSLTSSLRFEKEKKNSSCDDNGRMVHLGRLIWLTRPRCSGKKFDTQTHTHTLRGICSIGCRPIWPSHKKRLHVVQGEVLECFTAFSVHNSTSLGCICCHHMTQRYLLLSIKGETTEESLKEDLSTSSDISIFFSFLFVIQIWRTERRSTRFRSESDAMCHMENKQEGNLSRREESGFLRI